MRRKSPHRKKHYHASLLVCRVAVEAEDPLELDVTIADREYFLRQASSGLVAGPKSKDRYDRHITMAMDIETEHVKHIHMKSGRNGLLHENWRIYPSQIMPGMVAWIRDNSVPLGLNEIRDLDKSSYSIRSHNSGELSPPA